MKRFIVIALVVVAAVPLLLLAQPPMRGGMGAGTGHGWMGMHPGRAPKAGLGGQMGMGIDMILRSADKLGITDDQRAKLEKMQSDFELASIDQEAKIRKGEVQMRVLMRDPKSSVSAVDAQIDQMAQFRGEMAKLRYHHMTDVRNVLTDKQRDMLKQMREERPGMMMRHGAGQRGDMDDDDDDDGPGHPGEESHEG